MCARAPAGASAVFALSRTARRAATRLCYYLRRYLRRGSVGLPTRRSATDTRSGGDMGKPGEGSGHRAPAAARGFYWRAVGGWRTWQRQPPPSAARRPTQWRGWRDATRHVSGYVALHIGAPQGPPARATPGAHRSGVSVAMVGVELALTRALRWCADGTRRHRTRSATLRGASRYIIYVEHSSSSSSRVVLTLRFIGRKRDGHRSSHALGAQYIVQYQ